MGRALRGAADRASSSASPDGAELAATPRRGGSVEARAKLTYDRRACVRGRDHGLCVVELRGRTATRLEHGYLVFGYRGAGLGDAYVVLGRQARARCGIRSGGCCRGFGERTCRRAGCDSARVEFTHAQGRGRTAAREIPAANRNPRAPAPRPNARRYAAETARYDLRQPLTSARPWGMFRVRNSVCETVGVVAVSHTQ